MRMALLTAQKMGDDIVQEANKKRDDMLSETENEIEKKRQSFSKECADEEARLETAKARTLKFIQASREIIEQHGEFLSRLDEITSEFGGVTEAKHEPEPIRSPEPELPGMTAVSSDGELDDTIKGIDALVSDVLEHGGTAEEPEEAEKTVCAGAAPEKPVGNSVDDSSTQRIDWPDDDEVTTPRPKFDFKDLKFGSNYFED